MVIGISKYFQMACVVEKLAANMNREVTAKSIWDHLGTMYDLNKMVTYFLYDLQRKNIEAVSFTG